MLMVNSLAGFGARRAATASAFDPSALFASSEQGVWYDRADFATLFQTFTGYAAVTSDGQSVGLALDKSQGLVLGSELSTNGDFSSGTSPWSSDANITLTNVSNELVQTATSSGWLRSGCRVSGLSLDTIYKISIDIVGGSLTTNRYLNVGIAFGGYSIFQIPITDGNTTVYAKTNSSDTWLDIGTECNFSNGQTVILDNFSCKKAFGNHAIQATSASRPQKTSTGICDWIDFDGVDDALVTTFTSSLGSSCTVARAVVGSSPTILTSQTIGTSFSDSTDSPCLIIVDRALTGQETTDLTAWLTAVGAT